ITITITILNSNLFPYTTLFRSQQLLMALQAADLLPMVLSPVFMAALAAAHLCMGLDPVHMAAAALAHKPTIPKIFQISLPKVANLAQFELYGAREDLSLITHRKIRYQNTSVKAIDK